MSRLAATPAPADLWPQLGRRLAGASLRRELDVARRVQARLLPRGGPEIETLEYAGLCRPVHGIGGDYYDFLGHEPGHLGLALGDVSGKGIAAALLMAGLQAHLRSQYRRHPGRLDRVLQAVNREFLESTGDSRFATLFLGRYDAASRRLRYVNCGHTAPVLLRAGGAVERLPSTGPILGVFPRWHAAVREITLHPGDSLVLVSDGLVEETGRGDGEFGEARLIDLIRRHRHLPPAALCRTLLRALYSFAGRHPSDDMTTVVARGRAHLGSDPRCA